VELGGETPGWSRNFWNYCLLSIERREGAHLGKQVPAKEKRTLKIT